MNAQIESVMPSDSDTLSEIACLYNATEAVINSLYKALEEFGTEGGQAYGLAMALNRLNDQIGKLTHAI